MTKDDTSPAGRPPPTPASTAQPLPATTAAQALSSTAAQLPAATAASPSPATAASPLAATPEETGGPGTLSFWDLRLYVAGQTPRSIAALANLERICGEHLAGKYRVEIIDLMANPQMARTDQILAIPTLVRKLPAPVRKIIGDLSQTERVLIGLDVRPHG